jgi:hypothetical protein
MVYRHHCREPSDSRDSLRQGSAILGRPTCGIDGTPNGDEQGSVIGDPPRAVSNLASRIPGHHSSGVRALSLVSLGCLAGIDHPTYRKWIIRAMARDPIRSSNCWSFTFVLPYHWQHSGGFVLIGLLTPAVAVYQRERATSSRQSVVGPPVWAVEAHSVDRASQGRDRWRGSQSDHMHGPQRVCICMGNGSRRGHCPSRPRKAYPKDGESWPR